MHHLLYLEGGDPVWVFSSLDVADSDGIKLTKAVVTVTGADELDAIRVGGTLAPAVSSELSRRGGYDGTITFTLPGIESLGSYRSINRSINASCACVQYRFFVPGC